MEFLKKNLLSHRENALIALLSVFCFVLIAFRMVYSDTIHYRFLVWNLFLALVPLAITYFTLEQRNVQVSKTRMVAVIGAWLLFFPNAPYILTDLFHLKNNSSMPIWFDLVLILSFAWTGLLAGFMSLKQIENELRKWLNSQWVNLTMVLMLFLSGFGIYLGRYLRWNSWDIIQQPGQLAKDVADRFVNPFNHPRTWGVTFFVGLMLIMMYYSLSFFKVERKSDKPFSFED